MWIYVPTASGLTPAEIVPQIGDSVGTTNGTVSNILDAWQFVTLSRTIEDAATSAFLRISAGSTAALNEYFYVDDVKLATHNIPGTHYLSDGYIETLYAMPNKYTLQIKAKPNFAYDTGTNQGLQGWTNSSTVESRINYIQAVDKFAFTWQDGGTERQLFSAQYDDGTTYRNINQYITFTIAFDSTGGQTGSTFWIDKNIEDNDFGGAPDAHTSELNKMQIRDVGAGVLTGDYDIAYVLMIPDLVATNADVQNDFKDIKEEQIFWSLDGHGTGRTRCNVTRHVRADWSIEEVGADSIGAKFKMDTMRLSLNNLFGEYSDDQNAAFDPTADLFNGTTDENFLQQKCSIFVENWQDGDFDSIYVGRLAAGFPRNSVSVDYSIVDIEAEDGIADMQRSFETYGRYWEDYKLCNRNLIDRQACESTTPPAMYGETTNTLSNATFAKSTAQAYHGTSSYLFTVDGAADTWVDLQDALSTSDMHVLKAGETYRLRLKLWIPSGAMTGTEAIIAIGDYHGGAWSEDTQAAVNTYDAWQQVEVTSTLNSAATGVYVRIQAADAAVATETFYVDDIELVCTSDFAEHTDRSLLDQIAHRADISEKQYLANNSFENATIGNSWLVTAGGTLNKDAADGLFGSASGELIPGASAEVVYQDVLFTGTKKLNVGETYNFACFVKSSAAASGANNQIKIRERGAAGGLDVTSTGYVLSGGEGYKKVEVSHTITDSDSNELRVEIGADAGDTINIDGAMLIQADRALDYFEENTDDGSSGEYSAENAKEITWPWFGIDATNIDVTHPWRRMDRGTNVWAEMTSLGLAENTYQFGFNESGTFTSRAFLEDGYTDPVIGEVFEDTEVRRNISTSLTGFLPNSIIGHADKIQKSETLRTLYMGAVSDAFDLGPNSVAMNETVENGERWPNPDTYPEYWAQIGTYEERDFPAPVKNAKAYQEWKWVPVTATHNYGDGSTMTETQDVRMLVDVPVGGRSSAGRSRVVAQPVYAFQLDAYGWVEDAGNNRQVIGAREVDLIHKLYDTGDGQSAMTEVTEGTVLNGLDATSRAAEIRVLLENNTGSQVRMSDMGIVGKPVFRLSDASGYVMDPYRDLQDIGRNGEQRFEFGNRDMVDRTQLEALYDYFWKVARGKKHEYSFTLNGLQHWLHPGMTAIYQIGEAGKAEYIDSVVRVRSVRMINSLDTAPITMIQATEIEQNWKHDSNMQARMASSGNDTALQGKSNEIFIGSEYYVGPCDVKIAIGDTSQEDIINAAISDISGTYGGGVVRLSKGTYITDAAITMLAGVDLIGEGLTTIIKPGFTTGWAIGSTSGANIGVYNLRIEQTGSSPSQDGVRLLGDNNTVQGVEVDGESEAIFISGDNCIVRDCRVYNFQGQALICAGSKNLISGVLFDNGGVGVTSSSAKAMSITGADNMITDITIKNIVFSNTGSGTNFIISITTTNTTFGNIAITDCSRTAGTGGIRAVYCITADNNFNNFKIDNVDNTVTAADSYGFWVSGDRNVATGLNIQNCSGTAIYVQGAGDRNYFAGLVRGNGTALDDNGTTTTALLGD
jgi:hypothetical protein